MSDQTRSKLDEIRKALEHFRQEEARLSSELGEPSHVQDLHHLVPSEAAFDALTPSEVRALYDKDKPRWEALMKAKEEAGMRRLFS